MRIAIWIREGWEWMLNRALGLPCQEPEWFRLPVIFDSPKQIVVRKVVDSRKRLRPLADHNRSTVLTVHGLGIEEVPLSLGS
jgi:hypothetical protein